MPQLYNKCVCLFVFANEWFTWLITQREAAVRSKGGRGGWSWAWEASQAVWGGSAVVPLGVFDAVADTV